MDSLIFSVVNSLMINATAPEPVKGNTCPHYSRLHLSTLSQQIQNAGSTLGQRLTSLAQRLAGALLLPHFSWRTKYTIRVSRITAVITCFHRGTGFVNRNDENSISMDCTYYTYTSHGHRYYRSNRSKIVLTVLLQNHHYIQSYFMLNKC